LVFAVMAAAGFFLGKSDGRLLQSLGLVLFVLGVVCTVKSLARLARRERLVGAGVAAPPEGDYRIELVSIPQTGRYWKKVPWVDVGMVLRQCLNVKFAPQLSELPLLVGPGVERAYADDVVHRLEALGTVARVVRG
jgi:hypothetical protein